MKKEKILVSIVALLVISLMGTVHAIAKADDVIIQDDGTIEYVVINNEVLGESTTVAPDVAKTSPQQSTEPQHTEEKQSTPPPSNPVTQIPVKTVPVVAPHTESTVQINPPINNGKKVQVVITTQVTAPQIPSPVISPHQSSTVTNGTNALQPTTQPITNPPLVTTESVDQVVAQGSSGKPVISVSSSQAHQLTIQQGNTQVTTSLPLQIDTLTHSLSIPSSNQSAPINVLPSEALQGVINNGLLTTQNANQAKIKLTQDITGINYTVSSQKQGKLLGIFPVQSPIQVKLSAQNGKVMNVSQQLLFTLFGGLIR